MGHSRNKSSIFSKVSFNPQTSVPSPNHDPPSPSSRSPVGKIRRRYTSRSSSSLSSLGYAIDDQGQDVSGTLHTRPDAARQSTSDSNPPPPNPGSPVVSSRPSLSLSRRSIFGSIRGLKFSEEDTPPGSAVSTSSRSSSFHWREFGSTSKEDPIDIGRNRTVIYHGEAITNSGLFWKKREYLVLTQTHLIRFKSQGKASEKFPTISPYPGRTGSVRHATIPLPADVVDDAGFGSAEGPGERATAIPLRKIVAVFSPEEGRSAYSLDIHYLDEDHPVLLSLQISDGETLRTWSKHIKREADHARLTDPEPISSKLAEYAARILEKEHDYDVTNFKMYRIVKRVLTRASSKATPEEPPLKASATICFLVIGLHKIHIVHLPRSSLRQSSTSLADIGEGGSFGILTLAWILVSGTDDTFTLAFRSPFQKPVQFQLAAIAASEIALEIRQRDVYLRPLWTSKPHTVVIPGHDDYDEVERIAQDDDLSCFDRTLMAFCAAYGVNSGAVRYAINETVEDSPRLELLRKETGDDYLPLELLAILKTLRFNESFRSISVAGLNFDSLNGVQDRDEKGDQYTDPSENEELSAALFNSDAANRVLVHEIRAIAITNSRLRRLDFSGCIGAHKASDLEQQPRQVCDFIHALVPLCTTQSTNVDWIALNGIPLSDFDVQLLADLLGDRSSHIRAIELNDCGLTLDHTRLLFDKLATHDNTLEAIEFASNILQLHPNVLTPQLQPLNLVRKLNLTNATLISSGEPLLTLEVLSSWRLEEFKLRGIQLDEVTIQHLCE